MVIAGAAETGKTFFIGSAPEPIIILDFDDGTEAFWEQYDYVTEETYDGLYADKDIRVIELAIDEDLEEDNPLGDSDVYEFQTSLVNALKAFESEFAKVITAAKAGLLEGGTVALETASWLWMACMDHMKYTVLKLDPTARQYVNAEFDWDHANKKYINIYKQLMGLRKYGVNVIITVHTKDKYEEKETTVKGKKKKRYVKSEDEVLHWMKKSPQMSPLILYAKNEVRIPEGTGTAVEVRETIFMRLRGVPNAARLSETIVDITWDKLLQELHNIRIRHQEGGMQVHAEKKTVERRKRRRGRQASNETPEKEATPEIS